MSMLALALAAQIQQAPPPPLAPRPVGRAAPASVELPMPAPQRASHYKGLRLIYGKAPPTLTEDLGIVRLRAGPTLCTVALTEVYDKLVEEAARRGATAVAEVRTDPDNDWNMSNRNFICRSGTTSGPNTGTVILIARLIRP